MLKTGTKLAIPLAMSALSALAAPAMAAFDNAQVRHAFNTGVIKLKFAK